MKFINNRQNGDSVLKAVSTVFSKIGQALIPDGLGAYIPFNGKNLITFTPLSGTFTVGETVTGGTSTATGTVVSVVAGAITITSLTGTFVAGETITGGSSAATGTVLVYTVRNRIVGINDQIVLSSDSDYATAGVKIGVQQPVNLMDKLEFPVSSGTATAALVGNYLAIDPANPDSVIATATTQALGQVYVTDFINATTVQGYLSRLVA